MADPRSFYTETIPTQFNRALDEQEELGAEGAALLEGMKAVDATLCVEIDGERFYLNIAAGRMSAGDSAAQPPFLTLVQDRHAFERISAEAGDSAMALLGGLSGLAGEMKLTRSRIDNLAMVNGCIRFEVTGDDGFALLTHFGPDPVPAEPNASIRVAPDVYAELREGRLDPPQAFMDGKIQVDGDMQLTMQLALAAISPD